MEKNYIKLEDIDEEDFTYKSSSILPEELLIKKLNEIFGLLKQPIYYSDLRKLFIYFKDDVDIINEVIELNPELVIAEDEKGYGFNILSFIASITNILVGKRLAFELTPKGVDLMLMGFNWWKGNEDEEK